MPDATKRSLESAQRSVQKRAQAGQTQSQVFTITEDGKTQRWRITPRAFGALAKKTRLD